MAKKTQSDLVAVQTKVFNKLYDGLINLSAATKSNNNSIINLYNYITNKPPNMPIGTVVHWAGMDSAKFPKGAMQCRGQSIAIADYPELFDLIKYTYGGAGPRFNLPDTSDRFIRTGDISNLGTKEEDAVQNAKGVVIPPHNEYEYSFKPPTGIFKGTDKKARWGRTSWFYSREERYIGIDYDLSRQLRTADETRPKSIRLLTLIIVK